MVSRKQMFFTQEELVQFLFLTGWELVREEMNA